MIGINSVLDKPAIEKNDSRLKYAECEQKNFL